MQLPEMIYRRKSVRSYTGVPVDEKTLEELKDFTAALKPLYPGIKVQSEIVRREQVKCIFPWTTPQLIAIFGENKEGVLENVGFLYQQLDLYLQSRGLGVCWLGMGRLSSQSVFEVQMAEGMDFVIMLAFGHPKGSAQRESLSEFKRKALSEISDRPDERLEPARLAPSSVNSQPWYFTHEGDSIHAYCSRGGLLKAKPLSDMNRIDMGIALAHMYVANPDTFRFFRADSVSPVKGHEYIGSFSI